MQGLDLNLLRFAQRLRIRREGERRMVFDPVRKRWVALLPEEFVRQLLVWHLLEELHYPATHMKVEMGLKVNELEKRCDLLVYDRRPAPWLLVECKAPEVKLGQQVFRQIATYNLPLRVPYLLVTNGRDSHCCRLNWEKKTWQVEQALPRFPDRESLS